MSQPSVIPIDLIAEALQLKLDGLSLPQIAEHCYVRGMRDAIREELQSYRESPPQIFEALPAEMPHVVEYSGGGK